VHLTTGGPADGTMRTHGPSAGRPGLSKSHIPSRLPASGLLEFYRGANLMKLKLRNPSLPSQPPKRGVVSCFTDSSRRRMLQLMAKLDRAVLPYFVTLTYPDAFPLYRHDYKRHLETLALRIRRRWPQSSIVWKIEFKARKSGENAGKLAPHYHLFIYGVPWTFPFKRQTGPFARVTVAKQLRIDGYRLNKWTEEIFDVEPTTGATQWLCSWTKFEVVYPLSGEIDPVEDDLKAWISRNWYEIVASGDGRHFRAGTRVEEIQNFRQATGYASKRYMAKAEEVEAMPVKPGRFWGVIGRRHLPLAPRETVELTADQCIQLRRCVRRHRRANTPPEKRKFIRRGQFKAPEFTLNFFCDATFWMDRLERLLGRLPLPHELPKQPNSFGDYLNGVLRRLEPEAVHQPTPSVENPKRPTFHSWLERTCTHD
jgi:hypothetical protein